MTLNLTQPLTESTHPRDQLRLAPRFYQRSSLFGYLHSIPDLTGFWLLLLALGTVAFPWKIPCALGLVLVAYRMTFIIHDCSHHTLFATKIENEIVGWFTASCLFTSFAEFRRLHWIHHRHYREPEDPQGTDYNGPNPARDRVLWHLFKPLLFINAVEKLSLFLALAHSGMSTPERQAAKRTRPASGFTARVGATAAISAVQACIFMFATNWLNFLPGYLLFLLPLTSLGLLLSRVRSYLEHGVLDADTDDSQRVARTHRSNWIERNVLCSIFFNYHNEHHRWPQIPSRFLPTVHREITAGRLPDWDYSPSYVASLVKLIRASRKAIQTPIAAGLFRVSNWVSTGADLYRKTGRHL